MTDKLRDAAQQALSAPGCERLKDWYEIGPAQRAAVETFLEAVLSQQDAQAVPQGATFAGWLREWEGDDSDLGQWLFAATEEDKDDSPNWRPVYWLNAAPTPPAQQEWIDDAGRLRWALWRIKDLEQQLSGRSAAIAPPSQSDDEHLLRLLLAVRVAGPGLYTDNGEMSDCSATPHIDFKRDGVKEIERKLIERGMAKAWGSIGELLATKTSADDQSDDGRS